MNVEATASVEFRETHIRVQKGGSILNLFSKMVLDSVNAKTYLKQYIDFGYKTAYSLDYL